MSTSKTVKVGDTLRILGHVSLKNGSHVSDNSWLGEEMTIKAMAYPFVLVEQTGRKRKWPHSSDDLIFNVQKLDVSINGREDGYFWDFSNASESLSCYNEFRINDVVCDVNIIGGRHEVFKVITMRDYRVALLRLSNYKAYFEKRFEHCTETIEDKNVHNNNMNLDIWSNDWNCARYRRLPMSFVKVMIDRMEIEEPRKVGPRGCMPTPNLFYRLFPEQMENINIKKTVFYAPTIGQVIRVNIICPTDSYKLHMVPYTPWVVRRLKAENEVVKARETLEKASQEVVKAELRYEEARKALEEVREEQQVVCPICEILKANRE
jgi:hypothetical protein